MKEVYPVESYGRIALSKSNYRTEEEFWKDVADLQRILINNRREVMLGHEDAGVYNLIYAYDKHLDYGGACVALVDEEDEEDEED